MRCHEANQLRNKSKIVNVESSSPRELIKSSRRGNCDWMCDNEDHKRFYVSKPLWCRLCLFVNISCTFDFNFMRKVLVNRNWKICHSFLLWLRHSRVTLVNDSVNFIDDFKLADVLRSLSKVSFYLSLEFVLWFASALYVDVHDGFKHHRTFLRIFIKRLSKDVHFEMWLG